MRRLRRGLGVETITYVMTVTGINRDHGSRKKYRHLIDKIDFEHIIKFSVKIKRRQTYCVGNTEEVSR